MARLKRRALTVPVMAIASVIGLIIGLALLPLTLLVDLFIGPIRRRYSRVAAVFAYLSLVHLTYLLPCLLAGLVAAISWDLATPIDRWLQRTWATALLRGSCWLLGMHLGEGTGPLPDPDRPVLVFSRHVSVLDVLVPMLFVARHGHPRMRYVLKSALKANVLIDLVGARLTNAFIDRRRGEESRAAVSRLGVGLGPGAGVVIYPEGTRATPARRQAAYDRLEAAGLEDELRRARGLKHLLPPRPGGMLALLDQAPDAQICFLVHQGMEHFSQVTDLVAGQLYGQTIRIHRTVVSPDAVPTGKSARVDWIWQQWEAMDLWLSEQPKT